jgi:uncharacterized membrane protein YjgN (DUF898 family)
MAVIALTEPQGEVPLVESLGAGRGRFLGHDREYWRILFRGALLLMVTLGIYRFWLATDTRRFLWANTEIAGDGLEYTGTALELLLGFLVAIALLIPVYVAFFLAALDLGLLGQMSAVLGVIALWLLGYFAVYRARRYRLTRTVFRGIRCHQTGSAWRYAFCALFWWTLTIVTFGLAYPWAQTSLERYKMRHTYYGDLPGRFEGSGFRLFLRGFPMWFLVVVPLFLGLLAAVQLIDWEVLIEALGSENAMSRLEDASAGLGAAIAFAVLAVCWSVLAAVVFYPAFQALVLRWWTSGLRFGELKIASHLRTGQVYSVYVRFLWYAFLFALVAAALAAGVLAVFGLTFNSIGESQAAEVGVTVTIVAAYMVIALGYSTIYQGTVKLRLWRVGFESLELTGTAVLDQVKAAGAPSSAVGEGLADALDVGGL